jgi:hypothetical protein
MELFEYEYIASTCVVRICRRGEKWFALIDDENVGSYMTAAKALDDLLGGSTFSGPGGIDPSTLNLPDDLADWTIHRRPR